MTWSLVGLFAVFCAALGWLAWLLVWLGAQRPVEEAGDPIAVVLWHLAGAARRHMPEAPEARVLIVVDGIAYRASIEVVAIPEPPA